MIGRLSARQRSPRGRRSDDGILRRGRRAPRPPRPGRDGV